MDWHDLDADVFLEAAREDRLVILSVGAGWCHWCHVMDEETWADPEIERRVAEHFVAVRVDQDARPDISDSGDWDHPHYEKIVPMQADDLRAFALAWATWRDDADRDAALAIAGYVDTFLWDPDGGYRASQDADVVPGEHAGAYFALDDAGRRAIGVPRVDPHRYARENGLLASALADAGAWLGDAALVDAGARSAEWSLRERGLPRGGFSHDGADPGGPWLADTLAMGEAFVALELATGDPRWLDRAAAALDFAEATFRVHDPLEGGGYLASASGRGHPRPATRPAPRRERAPRGPRRPGPRADG